MCEDNNIVFVNQATGYLTIDIINNFVPYFKNVALITGSIRVQDIELDNKVKCSKIFKYDRGSPIRKFISWFIGTIQIFSLLLFKYRKYQIFYITVPPFAYLLSLFLSNRFSILIFDVYPNVLKIYGIKEGSIVFKLWKTSNKFLFKRSFKIFTISEGMAKLLKEYINPEKVIVIPLWRGLTKATPVPQMENPWLRDLHLEGKFIVQYSGNIGFTHNVEILVEIAKKMKNEKWCHFLIIGRGEKVNYIRDLILKYKLSNCYLLPFQPDEVIVYSLASADLGVVILDKRVADVSLPSKIYNLQAVGVPILGISPNDSALSLHLKKYNNGVCFNQEDYDSMIDYIKALYYNKEQKILLSNNSLKAAKDFTISNAKLYYFKYVSQFF